MINKEQIAKETEAIIKKGKELAKEKGREVVFLGQSREKEAEFLDINDFRNGYVSGRTGSGKSCSLISFIKINNQINPDSKWFFADGKSGGDFNIIGGYSDLPVAEKVARGNGSQNLSKLLTYVFEIYLDRQELFKKARENGKPVRNIFEYREHVGPLPRIWICIDEIRAFLGETDFDDSIAEVNSISNMIVRLLAEARSFGFTFIFSCQQYTSTNVPTIIRSNTPTKIFHGTNPQDALYAQLNTTLDFTILEKGEFFLINLDTNLCNITKPMNTPFLAGKDSLYGNSLNGKLPKVTFEEIESFIEEEYKHLQEKYPDVIPKEDEYAERRRLKHLHELLKK